MDAQDIVGILEVNISCPNVHGGGMSFGVSPDAAAEITRAVKAVTTKPVYIKLSPNVTDIVAIAKACENAGADGISMINTLLGARFDLRTGRPIIANVMGGFASAEDVIEMMYAGATAVEIGAENLRNPYVCKEIIERLPSLMDELNIEKLSDVIGRAHQ